MKRIMSIVIALAFMLSIAPAFAAPEQITSIPEEKQFSSFRFDLASAATATIDGQTVSATGLAGRGVATTTGTHVAYYDAVNNVVTEEIIIGDMIYVRTGNDTRWKAGRLAPATPIVDAEELPAGSITTYRLEDEVAVRGSATTQYQEQFNPSVLAEGLKTLNTNYFLSKADNARLKDQLTYVISDPTLGDVTLQLPTEYYGFDESTNVVNRPPADLVDAAQIDVEFAGAAAVRPWARTLVAKQLAELRAR